MTPLPARRYDFAWRRRNVAALVALAAPAMAVLVAVSAKGRIWLRPELHVNADRVEAAEEKINPNTASAASLLRLPKVGPVRAQAIVDYRASHGPAPFKTPEDLANVKGIGPGAVELARPYLSLPPAD